MTVSSHTLNSTTTSVWIVGGGEGSAWSKLMREQVVRRWAENDVLQLCDRTVCCHRHHIHEKMWHHLLLTHPTVCLWEWPWERVRNTVCEKGNYSFLPSGVTEWSKHGKWGIIYRWDSVVKWFVLCASDNGPGLGASNCFMSECFASRIFTLELQGFCFSIKDNHHFLLHLTQWHLLATDMTVSCFLLSGCCHQVLRSAKALSMCSQRNDYIDSITPCLLMTLC